MPTRVFIAGSIRLKHLAPHVMDRIDNIVAQNFQIAVGDADGIDASVQEYLFSRGATTVTVFCSGERPRNNVGAWPVQQVKTSQAKGSRAFFAAKDIRMAEVADVGLMIWDAGSTGTLSNVLELLARNKKSVVFVNTVKVFVNVATIQQLHELIAYMSEPARQKADEKIGLFDRIEELKQAVFQSKP
jgi:hypothetical protein